MESRVCGIAQSRGLTKPSVDRRYYFVFAGLISGSFTVTPSKMKMQPSQYTKSRIWEMKEDKYTKSPAKNLVCVIIHKRDIRKNALPKFIRLEWSRHVGVPLRGTMAAGNQQTHLFLSFPTYP